MKRPTSFKPRFSYSRVTHTGVVFSPLLKSLHVGSDINRLIPAATNAGAEFAKKMFETPYHTQEFDVKDLEDNIWTFGTYRPGRRTMDGPGLERRSFEGGLVRLGHD